MTTTRIRDLVLPPLGALLAGGLLTLVCLTGADGQAPWVDPHAAGVQRPELAAPYLLLLLAGVSLVGATTALARPALSGNDRLLGVALSAGLATLVAPELALAVVATAAWTAGLRRRWLGTAFGPPAALLASAAALGCGVLVVRVFQQGTGILDTQLPRPAVALSLGAPGVDVLGSAALLLAWGLASACMAHGPGLRRVGALLAAAVVVGAGPLMLHEAPWTFRWGGHVHVLEHLAYLAVLVAGLRALTGWSGLRDDARCDHLACCGLLVVAGVALGPGQSLLGALIALAFFVASLDRRRARDVDDLRWRHPRRLRSPRRPDPETSAALDV